MSDWGWHRFVNTKDLKPSESEKAFNFGRGHKEVYAVEYKKSEDGRHKNATEYYRVNPHRLNLGTIGFNLRTSEGVKIEAEQLSDIHQELEMLNGEINSYFKADGEDVNISTGVMPDKDALYTRIKTKLLIDQRATISLRFSYPTGRHADDANDWTRPDNHTSKIINRTSNSATIERALDSTTYYVQIQWEGQATINEVGRHNFELSTKADELSFAVTYSAQKPENEDFYYYKYHEQTTRHWNRWWNEGAIVDFSE